MLWQLPHDTNSILRYKTHDIVELVGDTSMLIQTISKLFVVSCRCVCFHGGFYSGKVIQHKYNRKNIRLFNHGLKRSQQHSNLKSNFSHSKICLLEFGLTRNYFKMLSLWTIKEVLILWKHQNLSFDLSIGKVSLRFEADQLFTATIGMTTENSRIKATSLCLINTKLSSFLSHIKYINNLIE